MSTTYPDTSKFDVLSIGQAGYAIGDGTKLLAQSLTALTASFTSLTGAKTVFDATSTDAGNANQCVTGLAQALVRAGIINDVDG